MPAAPRPKGKGKKIAWSLLGKPANLANPHYTKREKRLRRAFLNQQLDYVR